MNIFFSIWTWAVVAILEILCLFVQAALAVLTWPFDRHRMVTGRAFRLISGVLSTTFSPLWKFRVHGELPAKLPPRVVVVSNHESQCDPFLISRLPWEMKWLSKASIFKIPFVGWSMWLAGDIPLLRGNPGSARDAMALCKRKVEQGVPVMIFPEGTRSKTEELLPFKDGAFRLAIETGAAILPVAVHGTRRALPKHSWRVGKATAFVTVGQPISTQGMTLADVNSLSAQARQQIEQLRARLATLVTA